MQQLHATVKLVNHHDSWKKLSVKLICLLYSSGARGHDRMVVGFTTTYAIQNLEPLNPAHGEVHPIQHYVISVDVTCDRSVVLKRYK
jgi:hypothetical protein